MHFGQNNVAACGESSLLVKATSTDLQAVDCVKCLFQILAHGFVQCEQIAERIRIVVGPHPYPRGAVVQ